jgi:hypothetical protein
MDKWENEKKGIKCVRNEWRYGKKWERYNNEKI